MMNTQALQNRLFRRSAFTLVELLMVAVILVILASLTLIVTNAAANSAKEAKTRAAIQKLDIAIQQIFETYEEKFTAIQRHVNVTYPDLPEADRQVMAVHFIRDMMRMEMPQSWAEVYNSESTADPKEKLGPIADANGKAVAEPPVFQFYYQAYKRSIQTTGKEPGRAALLFLIIQNLNPEALESFHDSEVQDTDGDGLLEFVDAWGKPIQFLRAAPALTGSDLQPDILALAKYKPKTSQDANTAWWETEAAKDDAAFAKAKLAYPDPFDEKGHFAGWFLFPLIYSAGRDGAYDLITERVDADGNLVSPTSTDIADPFAFPAGMPFDNNENGGLNHYDNIHNHRRSQSF